MARREAAAAVSAVRSDTLARGETFHPGAGGSFLAGAPPFERWLDWQDKPSGGATQRATLVPTVCEGCPAACGVLAYVDSVEHQPYRVEGNPLHPGSQGRLCPGGLAAVSQRRDPDRVMQPMKRVGARGAGQWQPVSWDAALEEIAGQMRAAIQDEKLNGILVHLGEAEADPILLRTLGAWGIDALHLDSGAGTPQASAGYELWLGARQTTADLQHADTILFVGSPLDTAPLGPDARKLIEARRRGARVIVLDSRMTRSAGLADQWLRPYPGTESAILLAIANHIISTRAFNRDFMQRWWNWAEYMEARYPGVTISFARFELALQKLYSDFSFAYAALESGVPEADIAALAEQVARTGPRLSTWCGGASTEGPVGGWQISRALFMLNALLGAVGDPGGVSPETWRRFLPVAHDLGPAPDTWNALVWPREWPLASAPLSAGLPHMLREGRGPLSVYMSDRFNPVGSAPDGFSWAAALTDPALVGLHVALTPVWTETARLADLVLPVGHTGERHHLRSAACADGAWLALGQPVTRLAKQRADIPVDDTRRANPGQVWEEDELWVQLAWRLDPSGDWGIRDHFASVSFLGERMGVDEIYSQLLERGVPGLGEAAGALGQTALQYMRQRGVYSVPDTSGSRHTVPMPAASLKDLRENRNGRVFAIPDPGHQRNGVPASAPAADPKGRVPIGVRVDGEVCRGFDTPSGRLEFYSPTLADWGWPEMALPTYIKSHIHHELLRPEELVLLPLDEQPWDGGAVAGPWLSELAHSNPLWLHPEDARALKLDTGDAVRVDTEIGHFVTRVLVTEGVIRRTAACNLRRGRWRVNGQPGPRADAAPVTLTTEGEYRILRQENGVYPFDSTDPSTAFLWWADSGAPASLASAVHPDPVTGAHCSYQSVRVRPAHKDDRPGDVTVDLARATRIFERWRAQARPAEQVSPDGTRRPAWLIRPLKPSAEAWRLPSDKDPHG